MSSPASRSLLRLGTRIVLGVSAALVVSVHPLHGDGELPRFDPDCPRPLLRWHLGEADSVVRIGDRIAVAGWGGGATAHASVFDAVTPAENLQRQAPRQTVQDLPHVAQHERILRDVGAAHVLRQSGAGRLLADEILRRLRAVAHRQRPGLVQVGGLTHALDQIVAGDLTEEVAGLLGPPQVPLDDASVGLADPGHRLAGQEVFDLVDFQGLVGHAPAQDRNLEHLGCLQSVPASYPSVHSNRRFAS